MIRYYFLNLLFITLIAWPAYAVDTDKPATPDTSVEQSPPNDPPIITFSQTVKAVTAIQQEPAVLRAEIKQDGHKVDLTMYVTNDQHRDRAKQMATRFIHDVKTMSLDDDPVKNDIGTGLYTYFIEVIRANKGVLVTGVKPWNSHAIEWVVTDTGSGAIKTVRPGE